MALTEGWNGANVATLKSNIDTTFAKLVAKVDMLDNIYTTVKECWKGPDANKFLQDVYTEANGLIDKVSQAYQGISSEIDSIKDQWTTFQTSNQ